MLRRWRLQFDLRTLLVFMPLCGVAAKVGAEVLSYRAELQALNEIGVVDVESKNPKLIWFR